MLTWVQNGSFPNNLKSKSRAFCWSYWGSNRVSTWTGLLCDFFLEFGSINRVTPTPVPLERRSLYAILVSVQGKLTDFNQTPLLKHMNRFLWDQMLAIIMIALVCIKLYKGEQLEPPSSPLAFTHSLVSLLLIQWNSKHLLFICVYVCVLCAVCVCVCVFI